MITLTYYNLPISAFKISENSYTYKLENFYISSILFSIFIQ